MEEPSRGRDRASAWVVWSDRLAWGGVGVLFAALLFGALFRTDPSVSGPLETRLVFLCLLIQTFAFHAGIGLLVLLALALALRRRRLGLALGLGALLLLGPVAVSHTRAPAVEPGAGDLRVLSANVLYVNADPEPFMDLVLRTSPDVVLIQEYRASWSEPIRERLGGLYPHRFEHPHGGAQGTAVLSKGAFLAPPRPAPDEAWSSSLPIVSIEHNGERVEIGCVHLMAPLSAQAIGIQRRQTVKLGRWVEDRMAGPDAPAALILGGDFNAPYRTNHLRELRRAGLREAHDTVGAGRGETWRPRTPALSWAPGIRLDHVMFMGDIRCTGASVLGDVGSDHRPVWATFRVGQ